MGEKFPIYIISSAAASMHADLNFHDLGITGIFAKPVDVKAVVQTLNTHWDRDR